MTLRDDTEYENLGNWGELVGTHWNSPHAFPQFLSVPMRYFRRRRLAGYEPLHALRTTHYAPDRKSSC